MRVVIDTNCLLASIPPQSPNYWLYKVFEEEKIEWVVSNEIIAEYEEKLIERYSENTANLVLTILLFAPNTVFIEPYYNWRLIIDDPDDDKFVDVAIASGADFIITNDKHFKVLNEVPFPKVNVVSLQEFKRLLDIN